MVNASLTEFPVASMRTSCVSVIAELGESHSNLIAMGADGRAIFETFAQRFPQRYIDVGIAEATLVGVAAGLASTGRVVFVSAIGSFLLRRAYEQIRVDVCDQGLPVKLLGVGGGLSYGTLGSTHHLTEDIALTSVLPNMAVFIPCDAHEAVGALHAAFEWQGPAYVRLGAGLEPVLHGPNEAFVPGQPELLRDGSDLLIFATGYCVSQALLAAARLESFGHRIAVASISTLKPLNAEAIVELARGRRAILTVEEHSRAGGLGSLLADILIHHPIGTWGIMGIPVAYPPVGTREELIAFYGLDADGIVKAALRLLEHTQVTP